VHLTTPVANISAKPAIDSAVRLLADDLNAAGRDFVDAIRDHTFYWGEDDSRVMWNRVNFAKFFNALIEANQKTITSRLSTLARLASNAQPSANAEVPQRVNRLVRSTIAAHYGPRKTAASRISFT